MLALERSCHQHSCPCRCQEVSASCKGRHSVPTVDFPFWKGRYGGLLIKDQFMIYRAQFSVRETEHWIPGCTSSSMLSVTNLWAHVDEPPGSICISISQCLFIKETIHNHVIHSSDIFKLVHYIQSAWVSHESGEVLSIQQTARKSSQPCLSPQ